MVKMSLDSELSEYPLGNNGSRLVCERDFHGDFFKMRREQVIFPQVCPPLTSAKRIKELLEQIRVAARSIHYYSTLHLTLCDLRLKPDSSLVPTSCPVG